MSRLTVTTRPAASSMRSTLDRSGLAAADGDPTTTGVAAG
jgi:hypothetical protein